MFTFVRHHRLLFSIFLTVLFSLYITGCHIYKRRTVDREKALAKSEVQFYVLDEKFPRDFAWRIYSPQLSKTSLKGQLVSLTTEEAKDIDRNSGRADAKRSKRHVMLYVNNTYAQTLFDSTKVDLDFAQVARIETYEYDQAASIVGTVFTVIGLTAVGLVTLVIVIGLATGSCPTIYAENADGNILEGEPYVGATHPQIERHDWLPLTHLKANGDFYQIRIANEAPEIQHINLLELVSAEHPAGTSALFDKYGKLHTLANPESPQKATDLEGHDVRAAVVAEDNKLFVGNLDNANARAEDGLDLTFNRPAGAGQAKLLVRARNSGWLDYAHESLQQELGEYGPKVRQKFMEKDSADLQQWAMQQNIPLSVWLETTPGKWEKADFFNLAGTGVTRRDVLPLDLSKIRGNQVHIRLTSGFLFWEIDYVALDFSPDQPVHTRVLTAASATDQDGRDIRGLLQSNDNQYYIQPKIGDEARLSFPAPQMLPGMERSLFLHAKGHYQILREPVEGKPSRRYLRSFTQPDAFPKYSREQWNELLQREVIWVGKEK
jgi:hypothetical protein